MKIEKCHRNPMWLGDFVYYGRFSDGNTFRLHIPDLDIPKFIKTLSKALKDDEEGKVKVTMPYVERDGGGNVRVIKGNVERTDK